MHDGCSQNKQNLLLLLLQTFSIFTCSHSNVVYAAYTPVLRYMKIFYHKKNKYRYLVWTGLPPSTNLSFFLKKIVIISSLWSDVVMVLCFAQSVTCRCWMDGHERREQRRHGRAGSGGQRDDANQPDWHEHRWLPHSLITHRHFRAWGQKEWNSAGGTERVRCALSATTRVILLVELVHHVLNFTGS